VKLCHCPGCGREIKSEDLEPFVQLTFIVGTVIANAGIIETALHMQPDRPALRGWRDKLAYIVANLEREVAEMQDFGEAFDEDEEEDE
jgi:hypothetical protein